MAPPEPRKFFKVILSSTLQQGKMKIPKPFVKEQGGKLSEIIRLIIPTGQSWNVRVERESNDTLWLLDGVDKFLEDNSIGIEYILVFNYYGNSEFGVQIFDLTASEIVYTCIDDSVNCDDSSVECLGSSKNHLFPRKPARRDVLDGTNNVGRCYFKRGRKQVMEGGVEDDVKANHYGKNSTMYKDTERNDGIDTSPGDIGKERTVEPENKSSQNFFKVTLTHSYIKKQFLRVPADFARLHMPHSTRFIKVIDGEDNEWLVRFVRHYQNTLGSGWGQFMRDKELMVGDVCMFARVLGYEEVKLRVTISRSDGKNSTMYTNTERNDGIDTSPGDIGKERTTEPENESSPNLFKVTMTPTYIEKYLLVVPSDFARLHLSHSTRLIKLVDAKSNEWAIRYIRQRYTNILSSGWRHFVLDKKLMVGDVCIFERVFGGDEVKLRVTISRCGNKEDH